MRQSHPARAVALMGVLAGASVLAGNCTAWAQNTYADVPFNQGSLFYRPSGAKPPQTRTPSRQTVAPRRLTRAPVWNGVYRWQPQTVPAAPVYSAPTYQRYYVAPQGSWYHRPAGMPYVQGYTPYPYGR
jgi:hypothetical protein